ncbi:MAG: HAD family phosphatase [Candidatus Aenigmarchaeota archaeon]|nr:HAD family phosphatase [Candidatus Aenigmarchaeota archaeon]
MQGKPKIKAVIFDIGGVTLKWDDNIVYRHIAKMTGKSQKTIVRSAKRHMKRFDKGLISETEFWKLVGRDICCRDSISGLWEEHFQRYARRNEDVISAIKKLRRSGYKAATITNVIQPHYRYNKRKGLYKLFDKAFTSCNLHMRKPEKQIYLYSVKRLGVRPEECLFIDNQKENVAAARKAGMKALVFRNAGQMKKQLRLLGVKI